MKRAFMYIGFFIITIGILGVIWLNIGGPSATNYLTPITYGDVNTYKFNVFIYFKNVENNIGYVYNDIFTAYNPLTWQQNYTGDLNLGQFFVDLANNIGYLFNYVIIVINFVAFLPLKIAVMALDTIFIITGLNIMNLDQDSNLAIIKNATEFIKGLGIPLIGS